MKEFLKRIKIDFLLSSLLCIALGVIFIVFGASILKTIASIFAIGLIAIGLIYLSSYFLKIITSGFSVAEGICILAVGIWFLIQPQIVVSIIPIVIGVLLVFHSIRGIVESVHANHFGYESWNIGLIFSIISMLCGIICITNAFNLMTTATAVIGIILIYNGITNIWITSRVVKAEKNYNQSNGSQIHDTADFEAEFIEDKKDR